MVYTLCNQYMRHWQGYVQGGSNLAQFEPTNTVHFQRNAGSPGQFRHRILNLRKLIPIQGNRFWRCR